MTPQSKKDKFFMRGKDLLLFIVSSGAIISLVHIWETPKKVEDLTVRLAVDEAFANGLDKKQSIMEVNLENQTNILKNMQVSQVKMWEKITSR